MSKGEFRKDLERDSIDFDGITYITLEDAKDTINDIECYLNEIKDKLEPLTALSEIKEIYELVDRLSDKIY